MKNVLRITVLTAIAASVIFFVSRLKREKPNVIPQTTSDYVASIAVQERQLILLEGEEKKIRISLENRGRSVWSSTGNHPTLLFCELHDRQGNILKRNRNQFPLREKLRPGDSADMEVNITAPVSEGKYTLDFKLFKKEVAWFLNPEPEKSRVALTVKERKWPGDPKAPDLAYGSYTKIDCDTKIFADIFKMIRLTLHQNEVRFDGKTGKVFGFYAGSGYPQIWLRDANTLLPVLIYFYESPVLSSWLEEHLVHQKEDGSLQDTIDETGRTGKNTTETDQETSAVQSGYQVYRVLGPHWLQKEINGEKIIHRLEQSLRYLLDHRYDARYKLITGAHTADWGDVDAVDSDVTAVDVDERTHWTVDIYDQSMFYQSCLQIAEMLAAAGREENEEFWRTQAQSIRQNANHWLWQEDRGYFRVHRHTDDWTHDFDEDGIFPMGGNAQAVLSGMADGDQSRRIIEEALRRQQAFEVSTISGTLLPPYPRKFFRHPMLDEPYEYQNGGQWDWFGARLITAMFARGFSLEAKKKLLEIGEKNIANSGFFEWDSKDGIGQGSSRFLGSAGSIGQALFEGYFGIRMGRDFLNLEPKLGRDSAIIHVYQPATDTYVAYEYAFDTDREKLRLEYNSNFSGHGVIKIWNVWSAHENGQAMEIKALDVFMDGEKVAFQTEKRNTDTFIVIPTDFQNHTIRIAPR
ncbi:MAG: hypothetical protein JXB23_01730 [Candidatus Aminicenantes bacterium]|nr:hypothetical protein [Candidatus Aminicenantes bacterium]